MNLLSRSSATAVADKLRIHLTKRPLHRAVNELGGRSIRNEDIAYNQFGSHLALDYRRIFVPESRKERVHIVRNAYVPSKRRERYVDEIDRIIRTAIVSTVAGSTLIEDTSMPKEILRALLTGSKLENQIMLLVGGRGCGKTTFIDYCRDVKLPEEVTNTTVWAHVNLNKSPDDESLREAWMLQEVVAELRASQPDTDFDELETLLKLFAPQVNRLKKGALKLLEPASAAYNTRLSDAILQLQSNAVEYTKAICRFVCGDNHILHEPGRLGAGKCSGADWSWDRSSLPGDSWGIGLAS
jgi:hypothetical protein